MMWLSFIRDIAWKFIVTWGIISLLLIGWTTIAKSHSFYDGEYQHCKSN